MCQPLGQTPLSGSQWSDAGTNGLRVTGWGSSRLVRRVEAGPASSPHPGGEEARASGWSRLQGDGGAAGSGGQPASWPRA